MAYTVGQVASKTGVHIDTIRFYEQKELLPVPKRALNGYRLYEDDTVQQLQFILNAKALGFTLVEIKELLQLHHQNNMACCEVLQLTGDKIKTIKQRVAQLQRMQTALEALHQTCQQTGTPDYCPIIDALTQPGGKDEG